MRNRIRLFAATLCALVVAAPARAQIASSAAVPGAAPGWSFNVTPYVWLPTITANLQVNKPRGGSVDTTIDAGIGDYLSDINFGVLVGGVARYDRFSVMTDLVYLNASLTSSVSHFSSVNFGPGPIYIPRSQQLDTGTRLATTIWSLAGGYTLLRGRRLDHQLPAQRRHPGARPHGRPGAQRQPRCRQILFQRDRRRDRPHQHPEQQILPAVLRRCRWRRATVHLANLWRHCQQRRELGRCVGRLPLPRLPERRQRRCAEPLAPRRPARGKLPLLKLDF